MAEHLLCPADPVAQRVRVDVQRRRRPRGHRRSGPGTRSTLDTREPSRAWSSSIRACRRGSRSCSRPATRSAISPSSTEVRDSAKVLTRSAPGRSRTRSTSTRAAPMSAKAAHRRGHCGRRSMPVRRVRRSSIAADPPGQARRAGARDQHVDPRVGGGHQRLRRVRARRAGAAPPRAPRSAPARPSLRVAFRAAIPITAAGPVEGSESAAASDGMSTLPPRRPSSRWICSASWVGALRARSISRAAIAAAPSSTDPASGSSG